MEQHTQLHPQRAIDMTFASELRMVIYRVEPVILAAVPYGYNRFYQRDRTLFYPFQGRELRCDIENPAASTRT